jgi:hypothetical protein
MARARGQTGTIAPNLDTSCTNRTANTTWVLSSAAAGQLNAACVTAPPRRRSLRMRRRRLRRRRLRRRRRPGAGGGRRACPRAYQAPWRGSTRPYKHERRLDEDEIHVNKATSLVHTHRADQWASCKATRNPTHAARTHLLSGGHTAHARRHARTRAGSLHVAVQVAFGKANFVKTPVPHLIGSKAHSSAMGQSTEFNLYSPPPFRARQSRTRRPHLQSRAGRHPQE